MQIGSFSLIKELNTALILKIIRNRKAVSRSEIAKLTGLTPATVTNITSELLKSKIILETTLGQSCGGRKPVLLEFNFSEYNVIGVTITKHKITVSLTDLNSNLINQKTKKIPDEISPEDAIMIIKNHITEIIDSSEKKILGIGISMEGLIDPKNGVCVVSNNLRWKNVKIKDEILKTFDYPVFVDNDVNALTLSEKLFGYAKNTSDFILIYTGYGIGAGLISNGHVYRGASNYAFEIGHTTIDIDGPQCVCGKQGCLQTLVSERALIRDIKENGYDKKYFINEEITAENAIEKAKKGNLCLTELLKKQGKYLGIAISNFISLFNPSLIIISGFICKTSEDITKEITNQIKKNTLTHTFDDVNIIFSNWGANELYKGAVSLFISEFFENPEQFLR